MSDVELYEECPSSYSADVSRRHRWIRGDWQIARWLFPRVPGLDGRPRKNPLSMLSRWKIFDNLRRSLTAAALTLLVVLGWTALPSAWFWTLAVTGIILLPSLMVSILDVIRKPVDLSLGLHLAASVKSARRNLVQGAFTLACLPYEAFFSLDAMSRVVWRMLVSHKRLLQWNPSEVDARNGRTDLAGWYETMWFAPVLAFAVGVLLVASRPAALVVAGPVLGLWLASPAIAWWISRPLARRGEDLTAEQVLFLRKIFRKTWAFFETFIGPEDNWLPPDNVQEFPVSVIAHRTSPTNMGIALLANLSAYDFGIISTGRLIERSAKALKSMEALERHRGHFFNWYDTRSLKPLPPLYISSVDSGNLAGHLRTVRSGLLALPDEKILGTRFFESLNDTLRIALDAAADAPEPTVHARLAQLQEGLESAIRSRPSTLVAFRDCIYEQETAAAVVVAGAEEIDGKPEGQFMWWVRAFAGQCRDALDELEFLAPWIGSLPSRPCPGGGPDLEGIPTIRELAALDVKLLPSLAHRIHSASTLEEHVCLAELQELVAAASRRARARISAIEEIALQCETLARMEYGFLYDETHHLLAIGYNVGEGRRDPSCYDLLASEARLSVFVGIAQGELSQESWFALGRMLTTAGGEPILLSWSGSMFEYLMPLLVMPTYENSLLDQSYKAAVARQIEYGKTRGVPWGISESGYNAIDVHRNYQYRAFGVPGLGLKRGLAEDLVIAPYASALALMVAPSAACRNLERLAAEGFETRYGFYEAIDYTPSRVPRGQSSAVVRSFMAHHQGMSLLSLSHLLLDRPMQKRFETDPLFQATLLLLQERIPRATGIFAHTTELAEFSVASGALESPIRVFRSPDSPSPEAQLLSNGRYHVMVTNAGGGYSRWKDLAVTRWREDSTCDNWGTFCYIRDVASREFWSATYQPTLKKPENFEAIFSEGRAEFRRRDHDYETYRKSPFRPRMT